MEQNNTYATINPAHILQVLYKPKHVTDKIFYIPEKTVNVFKHKFTFSSGGFYLRENPNGKRIFLGKNINCLNNSNKYSYEYDSTNEIYTIYENAVVVIIYANNINKTQYLYYKDNSEAEKIYKQYVNIFNK